MVRHDWLSIYLHEKELLPSSDVLRIRLLSMRTLVVLFVRAGCGEGPDGA